jgi:hypothetical protein
VRVLSFLFISDRLFLSGDCADVRVLLQELVVPLLVKLKGSKTLAEKLVFPVFPPGHAREKLLLDFSEVTQADDQFDEFVTKCVARVPDVGCCLTCFSAPFTFVRGAQFCGRLF